MDQVLELVSEPRRQQILRLIWDGERSAGEIADRLPVSFSAVSQHLARLRAAGLVTVRAEGRRRFYRANRRPLGPLAAYLEAMWTRKLGDLKRLAEREQNRSAQ